MHIDSEKPINPFDTKKSNYLFNTLLLMGQFFYQFFNNFSALLLCSMYLKSFSIWLNFISDFCRITKY